MEVNKILIGERLSLLRNEKNMSLAKLAKKMGISNSAIYNYETGVNMPNVFVLECYHRIFHVSYEYLIEGIEVSETEVVKTLRQLPVSKQKFILHMMEELKKI